MKLDLLEIVIPPKLAQEIVEQVQQQTESMLIYQKRYDTDLLAVFAFIPGYTFPRDVFASYPKKLISLEFKRDREVYRLMTTGKPVRELLQTFPWDPGEEWFEGDAQTAYLCLQSLHIPTRQVAWLATCPFIRAWDFQFDLFEKLET